MRASRAGWNVTGTVMVEIGVKTNSAWISVGIRLKVLLPSSVCKAPSRD
jgi:hypothetical protein